MPPLAWTLPVKGFITLIATGGAGRTWKREALGACAALIRRFFWPEKIDREVSFLRQGNIATPRRSHKPDNKRHVIVEPLADAAAPQVEICRLLEIDPKYGSAVAGSLIRVRQGFRWVF